MTPAASIRLWQRIGDAASLLFPVIVVIAAYEVVARYGFNAPSSWVHEISIALAAASGS